MEISEQRRDDIIVLGPVGRINNDSSADFQAKLLGYVGSTATKVLIDFSGVELTASGNPQGTGIIYTDLLKSKTTGLTTVSDNDGSGDYWASKFSGANITTLKSESFASVGTTLKWSDVLTTSQIAALNSYLTANSGVFDIGIDPDCHFSVGGLSFTYTLGSVPHNTVPDVATTAFLLVISLAGLEVFRRQFNVTAKTKA